MSELKPKTTVSISKEHLSMLDKLAEGQHRSRTNMLEVIISKAHAQVFRKDKEADHA